MEYGEVGHIDVTVNIQSRIDGHAACRQRSDGFRKAVAEKKVVIEVNVSITVEIAVQGPAASIPEDRDGVGACVCRREIEISIPIQVARY